MACRRGSTKYLTVRKKILQPITSEYFEENRYYTVRNTEANSYRTRATYSPLNYLLQAVLFRIFGWELNTPLLFLYYLLRLTYVFTYTILGYWAIRLLPFGKSILLVLALAPTAVLQSATISADPVANGVSFLFIAWTLRLIINQHVLDTKTIGITLGLVFLLANIKLNAILLVILLVFISRNQYRSKKMMLEFWIAVMLIVLGVAGGWNLIAWQSDSVRRGLEGVSPLTLLVNNLSHPLDFIHGLLAYIWATGPQVIKGWIASTGYNYWQVHPMVFPVWLMALAAAAFDSFSEPKIPGRLRAGILAIFMLLTAGTFAIRFILIKSIDNLVSVSGRYFSAFSPLLFLGLAGWGKPVIKRIRWERLANAAVGIALLFFIIGQWMSYHVVCGSAQISGQPCILPFYKNWDPRPGASILLKKGVNFSQEFEPQCDSIRALRIYSFSSGHTIGVSGSYSLVDTETGLNLVNGTFNDLLPVDNYFELKFPSISGVANRRLEIQFQVEKADDSTSLAISEGDQYRGVLSVDGKVLSDDLLLKYVCDN